MANSFQHITAQTESGVLVISIETDRMDDYDLCQQIRSEMIEAVGAADHPAVVIDLGQVRFIASVGVTPFLSVNRRVRQQNGQLVLCNFSEFVEHVFTSTRLLINPSSLHSPFQWARTRDEAIGMLAN